MSYVLCPLSIVDREKTNNNKNLSKALEVQGSVARGLMPFWGLLLWAQQA